MTPTTGSFPGLGIGGIRREGAADPEYFGKSLRSVIDIDMRKGAFATIAAYCLGVTSHAVGPEVLIGMDGRPKKSSSSSWLLPMSYRVMT